MLRAQPSHTPTRITPTFAWQSALFFIPAWECSVAEERLEQRGKAKRESGRVGHGFKHVGNNATLLKHSIIEDPKLGRDLIPLEQGNARLSLFHQKENLPEN